MDFSNKSILVHYHHNFCFQENRVFISRNIGLWLEALSKKFKKVTYLSFSTKIINKDQVHKITSENISFISLGNQAGGFPSFYGKIRAIKYCIKYTSIEDFILIRGFTPLQNIVWFFSKPKMHKAFLLVRELKSKRPINFKVLVLLKFFLNKYREFTFNFILNSKGIFLSNSYHNIDKIKLSKNINMGFMNTNILSKNDIPEFKYNMKNNNDEINLLFVGRVSSLKGIYDLFRAILILKNQKLINQKINLKIVGSFSKEIKIDLLKITGSISKDSLNINFLGYVSLNSHLNKIYQNSDLFILPSQSEGFPRCIWEAAANSTPMLLTNVGGIPYLLKNNYHALIVKPHSPKEIAKKIKYFLKNKETAPKLAKNAHDLLKIYNLESSVNSLVQNLEKKI
ncbi:MAG: glycosyltransferase family 4 protein [Prochlorococcus marinus CUG1435]|nr:glycosyltransferase family 4 protein [Prochlorococcus marinus CUG1435]